MEKTFFEDGVDLLWVFSGINKFSTNFFDNLCP